MYSHIGRLSRAWWSYPPTQTAWGLVRVRWSPPTRLQSGPGAKLTCRDFPCACCSCTSSANESFTEAWAYLQRHHALLIEPDFGCGVPGAAQKCPKLPGWQSANCGDSMKRQRGSALWRISCLFNCNYPEYRSTSPVFLWPLRVKMGWGRSNVKTQMLLSFPPVAISPRGYFSLGAITHTQDTKFEWPDMQCISEKPLSGLSGGGERVNSA